MLLDTNLCLRSNIATVHDLCWIHQRLSSCKTYCPAGDKRGRTTHLLHFGAPHRNLRGYSYRLPYIRAKRKTPVYQYVAALWSFGVRFRSVALLLRVCSATVIQIFAYIRDDSG